MRLRAFRLLLPGVLLLALCAPAAHAGSIVYIQGHNVWRMSPDGSNKQQLTTGGTADPDSRYRSPQAADDGSIGVIRGGGFRFLAPDGRVKDVSLMVAEGSKPLSFDLTPGGGLGVFWYVHIPLFGGGSSFPRVVSMLPGALVSPCSATSPCHDRYMLPRFVHGSGSIAMVPYSNGLRDIDITTASGIEPWLTTNGPAVRSFDFTRTGFKVLIEAGTPQSTLIYWDNEVAPPAAPPNPRSCALDGFATGDADVNWSPDGTMFTWAGAAGIYVSPAPVIEGDMCVIAPRLIAPGGSDPDWGAADVPLPPPPPPPQPPVVAQPAPNAAPALSGLRVRRLKSGRRLRIGYTSSEPVTTTFTFARLERGVRRGGICKIRRAGTGRTNCSRYVGLRGSFRHRGRAGANRVIFSGRLSRRRLGRGGYRITAVATDSAGATSAPLQATVSIR